MRRAFALSLLIPALLFLSGVRLAAAQEAGSAVLRGRALDPSGTGVEGAQVTATPVIGGPAVSTVTDEAGAFVFTLAPGDYTLRIVSSPFAAASRRVSLPQGKSVTVDVTLDLPGLVDSVHVEAAGSYGASAVSSATKTDTPLNDLPQSVSVVSRTLMADQRMTSMADVVRYMPGVSMAQGEGNRDTPVLRGNSTTADFFVDGVRDDVQYFRDVYNLDRVEALKGPNAMIFGRGGVGGVINRVTRQADWLGSREAVVQFGSWGNRRLTADVGSAASRNVAVRATGVVESSDSYRDGVALERYGINPTVAVRLSSRTMLRAGYEHFQDERTADRGISSFEGRPVETAPGTFFGDPRQSRADVAVHLVSSVLEHRASAGFTLRNRVSYGDYDKFYQNVFPGAVDATGTQVAITAYNNATWRRNLFNQTDVITTARTGGVGHTLLFGAELGRQANENFRQTGFFTSLGPNATTFMTPLASPTVFVPVEFRQSATDADNDGTTTTVALYVQDQVALSERVRVVAGLRFDRLATDFTNNRTAQQLTAEDRLLSPRVGLIVRPVEPVSLYGSYTMTYLPRSGEQLSSLSPSNEALDPEEFRNYEVGAKWQVRPLLSLTAAVYQLNRGNVAVPDPDDPAVLVLVDAQRTRGVEVGVEGQPTSRWSLAGGYAWQQARITRSISATAQNGAALPHTPAHSVSLWNRVALTNRLAAGLGFVYRGETFAATDNRVMLPDWVRVDAAVYYDLNRSWRVQVNLENLFDERYYASAHNNTNITPGSPRAVRSALTMRF